QERGGNELAGGGSRSSHDGPGAWPSSKKGAPYPAIAGNAASSHRKAGNRNCLGDQVCSGGPPVRAKVRSAMETTMRTAIRRLGRAPGSLALTLLPALGTSVWAQSLPDFGTAIDDLVAANRILYRQGVVDGFGHISIRHPERKDRFLMSASLAPGRVSKADIMEFDLDGKPLDQRNRSIYSERFIHSEIYKARPDV